MSDANKITIPKTLETLSKVVSTQIPMLRLLRKKIAVQAEKQASYAPGATASQMSLTRKDWQYWFDPIDLIKKILLADTLVQKMYTGMAKYVDQPDEIYHSRAWGSSAMTTSGQFAHSLTNHTVLPGDVFRLENAVGRYTKARVIFVGVDYRSSARHEGKVVLTVQPVIDGSELRVDKFPGLQVRSRELLLIDAEFEVREADIRHPYVVHMDWSWDGRSTSMPQLAPDGYFIRQIINLEEKSWQSIRYTHPTRADIEVAHYGRDHLLDFDRDDVETVSVPFNLFLDDFGVFRSMTRSFKAFYITPVALSYWERRKPNNTFVLTLAPHKASLDKVVCNLEEDMAALAHGITMEINGITTLVKAFPLILTGDMPQQSDSAGFLRHNALKGCRCCQIPLAERSNLDYDIKANERHHFDAIYLRKEGRHLHGKERKKYYQKHGMIPTSPPIWRLAPTIDIVLAIGLDCPHVKWRGIGRLVYVLVLKYVLEGDGRVHFIRKLQRF